MGKDWFLLLGNADKQIVSDVIETHKEEIKVDRSVVEDAYKRFLEEIGVKVEA